jgi:Tfp pilus assembly protein PilF
MRNFACIVLLAAGALVGGCQSEPLRNLRADVSRLFGAAKGAPALTTGLRLYEEGNYAESARYLQSALYQGLRDADRLKAHKYLAFIHCVSDRIDACREEFGKALEIDGQMALSPAEAGHPIWGPVFRSVKAGR